MADPLLDDVYLALLDAINRGQRVALVLRGDVMAGLPVRTLEGVPYEIAPGRDGRDRVFLRIAEETEQIVLVERVMRVMVSTDHLG